jgi:glutamate---cysteine ligase / carboxylate-amine ligase
MAGTLPDWSAWSPAGAEAPWTVGVEEEIILLDPGSGGPSSRSDDVLHSLPEDLAPHTRGETHACALELATDPHGTVAGAVAELAGLRAGLAARIEPLGLGAAVAGTHPLALAEDVRVSPGARYQFLQATLRGLAEREPTFGLHVHVAVPDPALAVRALTGIRAHLPLVLALSANSPFWRGRDSGLASVRTPLFQAFPRVGIPRAFRDYADYVEAVDVLIRCGAIPEPTFLWWDARLQPRLGTLEVRIMDAQTCVADTAALTALVQCLVRLEALGGAPRAQPAATPEVLAENRFLAARDGVDAAFVVPAAGELRPASEHLARVLEACAPHARALGCEAELGGAERLSEQGGAARQRALAAGPEGVSGLMGALQAEFVPAAALNGA